MKKLVSLALALSMLLTIPSAWASYSADPNVVRNADISDPNSYGGAHKLDPDKYADFLSQYKWRNKVIRLYKYMYAFLDDDADENSVMYDTSDVNVIISDIKERYNRFSEEKTKEWTEDIAHKEYDEIISALKKATINVEKVTARYDLACKQTNENGYYPANLFYEYEKRRDELKSALDSGDNAKIEVAYFAFRKAHNDLCLCNPLNGDLDFNGKVNMSDVVYLQRALAGLEHMNHSQYLLSSSCGIWATLMSDVVHIQREIAGLEKHHTNLDMLKNENYNYQVDDWTLELKFYRPTVEQDLDKFIENGGTYFYFDENNELCTPYW